MIRRNKQDAAATSPATADTKAKTKTKARTKTKGQRLSVLRIAAAGVIIAGIAFGGSHLAVHALKEGPDTSSQWFAPYVDVTLPPYLDFQDPAANPSKDVVLSFVVASPGHACTPSWGGAYDLDGAAGDLDLDRRIVRLRERGGDVIASFGGVANDELATVCTDPDALAGAYRSVVHRYHLASIDLDLEGAALDNTEAVTRRATAIKAVQASEAKAGRKLDVWLTLPMDPNGLTAAGTSAVDAMLDAKVDIEGVNVMAMEYGNSRPEGTSFVDASLSGITATAKQVRTSYHRHHKVLTLAKAYARVGVTPMIGQNFFPADRLETKDARRLYAAASKLGVRRFSMWSLNRDAPCGGNIDPAISNNTCSGVDQKPLEFSQIFSAGGGRATSNEAVANAEAMSGRSRVNSGAASTEGTGPYQDWRPRREYDLAEKIVWRGQVYESKWWNVGAQPDAPVKHDWDSPWRVLGPVLEGDPSLPTPPTIPEGTYQEWSQKTIYDTGDRVEHLGVGYRAKWWTRGDDPSVDVDNDWQNPWEVVGPPPNATTTTTAPSGGPAKTAVKVPTTSSTTTTAPTGPGL